MRNIDLQLIVRGLAAAWVMFWHFEAAYVTGVLQYFLIPGRTAVWIFFGLSGYVIFHAFEKGKYRLEANDLKQFYRNRFLRIYPLFLLCTAAVLLIRVAHGLALPDLNLKFLIRQVLAIQYVHVYELNGVFWSLGVEIWFYLLAPAFYWALKPLRSFTVALVVYGVLFSLVVIEARFFPHYDVRTLTSNLAHFFVGFMALRFGPQIRARLALPTVPVIGAALCTFVFSGTCMALLPTQGPRMFYTIGAVAVDLGVFLLLLLQPKLETVRSSGAWLRALLTLGVVSYGVYVWHPAVIYAAAIDVTTAPRAQVWAAMLVSLLVAWVVYHLYERRFLALKRHRLVPPTGQVGDQAQTGRLRRGMH